MSTDIRTTATYQAPVNCLVRYLKKQRKGFLKRTDTFGPIDTDEARAASNKLDQLDHALTELGEFDTTEKGGHNGQAEVDFE